MKSTCPDLKAVASICWKGADWSQVQYLTVIFSLPTVLFAPPNFHFAPPSPLCFGYCLPGALSYKLFLSFQKSSSYTKIYSSAFMRKVQKKLKMKSQDRKNIVFGNLLWKRYKIVLFWIPWLQFKFFAIFSQLRRCISTLPVI